MGKGKEGSSWVLFKDVYGDFIDWCVKNKIGKDDGLGKQKFRKTLELKLKITKEDYYNVDKGFYGAKKLDGDVIVNVEPAMTDGLPM